MKPKREKLIAPLGFRIPNDIYTDNEKDVLELCMNMSDDLEFIRKIALDSHGNRIKFLLKNGFELE